MKTVLFRLSVFLAFVLSSAPLVHAFESRTWLTADGQLTDGTLVRRVGDVVEVSTGDNRIVRFSNSILSQDDVEYVLTNAPQEKKSPVGGAASAGEKIPNPAKSARVDRARFKRDAGEMKVSGRSYNVCETPHFKVLYRPPSEPDDLAELSERMWLDAAFFLSGFRAKWKGRKMAVIMANDAEALKDALLWNGADGRGAQFDRAGPEGVNGHVLIPQAQAVASGIFDYVRVLRGCATAGAGKRTEPLKGVWRPCNIHMLALDMLRLGLGRLNTYYNHGRFALTCGYALHKELMLAARFETRIVCGYGRVTEKPESRWVFEPGKKWQPELPGMIESWRRWGGALGNLMIVPEDGIRPGPKTGAPQPCQEMARAWAFVRFLQSTRDRITAFSQLCRRVDEAGAVPGLDGIAKIYGFANAADMEKAWLEWMTGPGSR